MIKTENRKTNFYFIPIRFWNGLKNKIMETQKQKISKIINN
jgi:hypothetical protein